VHGSKTATGSLFLQHEAASPSHVRAAVAEDEMLEEHIPLNGRRETYLNSYSDEDALALDSGPEQHSHRCLMYEQYHASSRLCRWACHCASISIVVCICIQSIVTIASSIWDQRPASKSQNSWPQATGEVMEKFASLEITAGDPHNVFPRGADPFRFQCPIPGASRHNSTRDTCCHEYDEKGWPYQFPQCKRYVNCSSCWKQSDKASFDQSPLIRLSGIAWAASAAVYRAPDHKKKTLFTSASGFVRHIFDGEKSSVSHAKLEGNSLNGVLGLGALRLDTNFCPNINDWTVEMLNDESDNIHARVYRSSAARIAVVVFRGTETKSLENWQVDVDDNQIPFKLGDTGKTAQVHEGFLKALQRVLPGVQRWVNGYFFSLFGNIPKDWTLLFAGHSLGGALAALASTVSEAEDWHRKPDATIIFGAPRFADSVMNAWWSSRGLCQKLLRINVYNDVVHWLPSSRMTSKVPNLLRCLGDPKSCMRNRYAPSSMPGTPDVDPWAHICSDSEIIVPGAMEGVNLDLSDLSIPGGVMTHHINNCLFGYGYGVLQSPLASRDAFCGLGPSICRRFKCQELSAYPAKSCTKLQLDSMPSTLSACELSCDHDDDCNVWEFRADKTCWKGWYTSCPGGYGSLGGGGPLKVSLPLHWR